MFLSTNDIQYAPNLKLISLWPLFPCSPSPHVVTLALAGGNAFYPSHIRPCNFSCLSSSPPP